MELGKIIKFIKRVITDFDETIKDSDYPIAHFRSKEIENSPFSSISLTGNINTETLKQHLVKLPKRISMLRYRKEGKRSEKPTVIRFHYSTIFGYFESMFNEFEYIQEFVKEIEKDYESNLRNIFKNLIPVNDQSFACLAGLITKVILRNIANSLSDEIIANYADVFKRELELEQNQYLIYSGIKGIKIEEEIFLEDGTVIAEGSKEFYKEIEDFIAVSKEIRINIPETMLFRKTKSDDIRNLSVYNSRILTVLYLFKLGDISFNEVSIFEKSIIKQHKLHLELKTNPNDFTYTITKSEKLKFLDFRKTINEILVQNEKKENFRILSLSLEKYKWALTESVSIDRRLVYAVMGLEPLFSMSGEQANSYKLGLRIAKLFSYIDADTALVREDIKDSYSFRNKVVHGGVYERGWKKKTQRRLEKILQYLRISLIFYLLNINKKKEDILESLDKALMDKSESKKIEKLFERYIDRFDVCFNAVRIKEK